jgi:AcrR family transcriptional regulator
MPMHPGEGHDAVFEAGSRPSESRPSEDSHVLDPRVARTRVRVLSAVIELIGEVGFGRVSMEAVAARAQVARSTLYRNWGDLATLLGDALQVQLQAVAAPDTGDLRSDLLAAMRTAAGFLQDRDLRSMVLSMLAESLRDPEVGRVHRELEARRRERFRGVLARGQRRGELPDDVDLDVLIDDLVAPVFHRALLLGEDVDDTFLIWHLDRTMERHIR